MTNLNKELEKAIEKSSGEYITCPYGDDWEYNGEYEFHMSEIVTAIKSTILAEIEKSMPKGYVAKDLDYKYIYYNQALTDCLEVIRKVLK